MKDFEVVGDLLGDVFGEEELVGRGIFAQPVLGRGTRVHESLCDDGETRIDSSRLVDIEDKVGILDEVDPEAQRQTAQEEDIDHQ